MGDQNVYLIADTTEDITINANDDRVIDLGGHTLTGTVTNYSTNLTIKNGNINGSIKNTRDTDHNNAGLVSSLSIYGVRISSGSNIAIDSPNWDYNTTKWTVSINDCTITSGNTRAIRITNASVFNINGATTITNRSNDYATILIKRNNMLDTCTLNINGGTIKNNGTNSEIYNYTEYGIGIGSLKSWKYNTINQNGGSYGTITQGHK